MTLAAIDWKTITRKQAVALHNAAQRALDAFAVRYNAFEADATDAEFYRLNSVEENLYMFIACGLKPDAVSRHGHLTTAAGLRPEALDASKKVTADFWIVPR